jgi:hypothetical protein
VFVVFGNELDVRSKGVDTPAHELGDGLGVLTPGVAVGLGGGRGFAPWGLALDGVAHTAGSQAGTGRVRNKRSAYSDSHESLGKKPEEKSYRRMSNLTS